MLSHALAVWKALLMQPRGTSYVGYVGLLTGMKPGAFSISLDQRDSGTLLENFLELLLVPNTMAACFLIRDTLQKQSRLLTDSCTQPLRQHETLVTWHHTDSFHEAVERLSHTSLVAPSYIIIGGVSTDEGAVVTRDRIAALDLWFLDGSNHRWVLHWILYFMWRELPTHLKIVSCWDKLWSLEACRRRPTSSRQRRHERYWKAKHQPQHHFWCAFYTSSFKWSNNLYHVDECRCWELYHLCTYLHHE